MIAFLASPAGLAVVAIGAAAGAAILSLWFRRILATADEGGIDSESGGSALPGTALAGLLSAVALVVPLIFTIAWADVFVLPKITALRLALLAGLALLALGKHLVDAAPSARAHRIVDVAVISFAALTCIATVVSVDPELSLVGRTEQYQGLVTTLLYVAFFFLAREALTTQRRLRVFAAATVAGSAVVGVYAVLQQLKLDPIFHTLDKGRVFATIGQAEWLGAYLVIGLALGAGLLWQVRGPRRLVGLLSLGVILVALLLTLSRGAYLGLAAAATVFAVAMLPGARPSRRWVAALPVLAIVVGAAFLLAPVRDEARVMASRAASTADLSEGSIADRLDLWQVGVEIAIDHPLLGTGPETYTELFPQYRDRMPVGRQTFWMAYSPESPHNVYLAIADGEGLPALAAYLTLVGAVLWQLARECTRAPSRAARALLAAVLAAAVGHLVADMFMTADVAGSWLTWLLLGAAVGYAERIGLTGRERAGPWSPASVGDPGQILLELRQIEARIECGVLRRRRQDCVRLVDAVVPPGPGTQLSVAPGQDTDVGLVVVRGEDRMAVIGQRPRRPRLVSLEILNAVLLNLEAYVHTAEQADRLLDVDVVLGIDAYVRDHLIAGRGVRLRRGTGEDIVVAPVVQNGEHVQAGVRAARQLEVELDHILA